jgi:hypothetical protein
VNPLGLVPFQFMAGAWYGSPDIGANNGSHHTNEATELPARWSYVVDGLSNTFLIHEQAGRPALYGEQQTLEDENWAGGGTWVKADEWWLAWARPEDLPGFVNVSNVMNLYSFHSGGGFAAFCDGSVRFISDQTTNPVFVALVTREGGEAVSPP